MLSIARSRKATFALMLLLAGPNRRTIGDGGKWIVDRIDVGRGVGDDRVGGKLVPFGDYVRSGRRPRANDDNITSEILKN